MCEVRWVMFDVMLYTSFMAGSRARNSKTAHRTSHIKHRIFPDELFMEEALREAQKAQALGEVPVGAVIVRKGKVIARGANRNLAEPDPTAHAEVVALREAAQRMGNHRLAECELYVTLEPCPMCAGALVHARLRRLVYGAPDPKAGAVRSVLRVLNHPRLNHKMKVKSGVLAGRCEELLREFFRSRRPGALKGSAR